VTEEISLGLGFGLGLAGLVLCCETRSCHGVTLVVIMILKDTASFQVLFIVSLFRSWNTATVEINSGVHLIKNLIRQVPLFTYFTDVVLVLVL